MSEYIEALTEFNGQGDAIFLAGGISNCPDWQSQMVELLKPSPWIILNPRRANFPLIVPMLRDSKLHGNINICDSLQRFYFGSLKKQFVR